MQKISDIKATTIAHEARDANNGKGFFSAFEDSRPQALRLCQVKEMTCSSPRTVIQRQVFKEAFGEKNTSHDVNKTGIPGDLKTGLEQLSGIDLSDVQVHYNSGKPALLNAHAYAQGTEIHIGPQQEQHLPHEAWHVIQQKQGRVKPSAQIDGDVNINDDAALENEAEKMGKEALQSKPPQHNLIRPQAVIQHSKDTTSRAPVQRVKGGMEYTEKLSSLHWYAGNGDESVKQQRKAIQVSKKETISGNKISFFVVPKAQLELLLGASSNDEHILLKSGKVKLINDEKSAEWVIERHGEDVNVDTMVANIESDIGQLYAMRDKLAQEISSLGVDSKVSAVVLGTDHLDDLDGVPAQGWFVYDPRESKGTAQITFQYEKRNSIVNIAKVNVSKYLDGRKLEDGEELGLIKTGSSPWEDLRDIGSILSNRWKSAWKSAGTLLDQLSSASVAIPYGQHDGLTKDTIGAIKLMVLNDALATTMSRFDRDHKKEKEKEKKGKDQRDEKEQEEEESDNIIGYAQEKNMQQFFPKSQRQNYVNALQRTKKVPDAVMGALRDQITESAPDMATAFWNLADPLALSYTETFGALGVEESAPLGATKRDLAQGKTVRQEELDALKDAVLGKKGALLSAWIARAAVAYTDTSGQGTGHQFKQGYGSVIRSDQDYTPVSGDFGAVYERREAEIPMAPGSLAQVLHAIRELASSA